jgi:hypothetical protein
MHARANLPEFDTIYLLFRFKIKMWKSLYAVSRNEKGKIYRQDRE